MQCYTSSGCYLFIFVIYLFVISKSSLTIYTIIVFIAYIAYIWNQRRLWPTQKIMLLIIFLRQPAPEVVVIKNALDILLVRG